MALSQRLCLARLCEFEGVGVGVGVGRAWLVVVRRLAATTRRGLEGLILGLLWF
jgi:hypothetical protein